MGFKCNSRCQFIYQCEVVFNCLLFLFCDSCNFYSRNANIEWFLLKNISILSWGPGALTNKNGNEIGIKASLLGLKIL